MIPTHNFDKGFTAIMLCPVKADGARLALARISHQPTAAGTHLPESTALHSDKGLDALYSTPAHVVSRAPCISRYLRSLASRSGEKSGLG